jgi:hypothetical protein
MRKKGAYANPPTDPQLEQFIQLLDLRAEAILNDFERAKQDALKEPDTRKESDTQVTFLLRGELLGGRAERISEEEAKRLDLIAGRFARLHERYKEELRRSNYFVSNEIINQIHGLIWAHRNIITPPWGAAYGMIFDIFDDGYCAFMSHQKEYPGLAPQALLRKLPPGLENQLFSKDDLLSKQGEIRRKVWTTVPLTLGARREQRSVPSIREGQGPPQCVRVLRDGIARSRGIVRPPIENAKPASVKW